MTDRPNPRFRPAIEPLEAKRPLSAGASSAVGQAISAGNVSKSASVAAEAVKPSKGFLVYRITNPNRFNSKLVPPFGHVLVAANPPVAGQTYNILSIAVRNGTNQTFDANSGFLVKFPGQPYKTPILTGDETWAPGQDYIFYVMTKQYYPLKSQISGGFQFSLAGASSVAIPGPSGIFLRVKYNPDTIDKVLDYITQYGPGAEGGKGIKYGLPDTALYEFLSSATDRKDFGGYF